MQLPSAYRVWSVLALLVVAGIATAALLPRSSAPMATTTPILEFYSASITTYLPSSATSIQDVRPMAEQRAVNLDGSLRAAPSQLMRIAGNPFENAWGAGSKAGVRLETGTHAFQDTDIALPAEGFSWVIGRSYNARQETSGSAHRNSDGYQGKNWFQNSQPEIQLFDDPSDTDDDVLYVVFGADRYIELERVDADPDSDTFKAVNGAAGVVLFEEGAAEQEEPPVAAQPDTYTLIDQHSNEIVFFGFDGDAGAAAGQIWKITDPDGNCAYVGHATTGSTAISSGYNGSGYITFAYDPTGRRFSYTYTTLDSVSRLTQVKAEINSGGWTEVSRVDYEYYSSESYGDPGDLKMVEITTPLTDSGVSVTKKKYYRYWEGSFHDTNNPGYPHAIMYVVGFEGTRNQDWDDDATFNEGFTTLSNVNLDPYAGAYFEYNSSHEIDKCWADGECGCGGACDGTHEFEYESNGSFSDTAASYDTAWKTRTVVKLPDATYVTTYFDEAVQALHRVRTDDDPDNTGPAPDFWATKVTRDSDGWVSTISTPANVTAYTHSSASFTTSTTAGLVRHFGRESSNELKGFVNARKWSTGTSGSQYYDTEWAWTKAELSSWSGTSLDEDIGRPLLDKIYNYHAISTSTSDRIETDYTVNVTSGTLALSDSNLAYVEPTLAGGGGYSDLNETLYYDDDGVQSWTDQKDGTITYRDYTDGRLTKTIQDVDTAETSDFSNKPAGLSSSGTEIHRITTYAYDPQGRHDTTTLADGQVTKRYYTKLADGRLVTLSYQDYEATPKFYGPVSYTVTNHAGKVEFQGRVALTNNESTTVLTGHVDETDSDPLVAMDLGTVCRMSTSIYDDTGTQLQESRVYFTIPGSGAGTNGTNYDPTKYGYDDMGRRWRTKEASGTIRRTVHDDLGRVASRWVGTNDYSFSGGEASGPDDMVQTDALVYDGGNDKGNSYVTKRTLYVEDDATDKRETTFTNDVRGRVLVEDRPTTPHAFHKHDNRGRRLATGLFSSTTNIVAGTDDPTTETSNRWALNESAYNDLGQIYESKRNKIDMDDGSDDDEIKTEYGYDEMGRRVFVRGSDYSKTHYDRLGRVTHRLILADEDDSTYSNRMQSTASGDAVLEEHQTVYDSDNDDVLMRLRIMRTPNSLLSVKPDSEADGDPLLVTAANLTGRAQITAYWYDEFGRQTDVVEYGTYGGSDFDRDGLSVPSRSDTALRTTTAYNDDGEMEDVTDPRALVTHFNYDDAGRQTKVRRNYDSGVNSGNSSGTDDNQTVVYEYTDGLRTKIKVDMPAGTDDQETIYTFGTTQGDSAGESQIGTGHLLQKVQYPDSSGGTDVVTYAYSAQGQRIYEKDQEGNVIEYDYDDSGRQTHRKITTLDADFDGDVRRITTAHDSLGRRSTVTQYDNATVGSGAVVDEVKFTYDDWGNIEKYEQDHDSTVGGGGSLSDYEVSYTYFNDNDGRPSVRRSGTTMPSGNVISYNYVSDNNDEADRVSAVKDGAVTLASYKYLGAATVVRTTYAQPGIFSSLYTTNYTTYGNLDRFNRVTTSAWTSDLVTDVDFYDFDVSWDRNGNVTLVEDNTHVTKDVSFTMDDLDRLSDAQQGTWGGSSISSEVRDEDWTLDHTGNWDFYRLDFTDDGDGLDTDEYEDDRTHNKVNELTGRDTDDNGTDDYTLVYDADGNLTDDNESYKYVYDPFGRLCEIKDQSNDQVADYEYNGLGHMKSVHTDTDDDGDVDASDKWFHAAYDERWRMVAYFREDDSDPKEEFIPEQAGVDGYGGSSYINGVICRDKDANTAWTSVSDGVLEERLYYCQNWRGDVIALIHKSRLQVESVRYSPYGEPFGLPEPDADSDGDRDAADGTQIQAWIDASQYDVRGDVDLDGDVDSTDKSWGTTYGASTLGWGALSWRGSRRGYSGYERIPGADTHWHARNRVQREGLGRWITRDPIGYRGATNLLEYAASHPVTSVDPMGLDSSDSTENTPRLPSGGSMVIRCNLDKVWPLTIWPTDIPHAWVECSFSWGGPTMHPCELYQSECAITGLSGGTVAIGGTKVGVGNSLSAPPHADAQEVPDERHSDRFTCRLNIHFVIYETVFFVSRIVGRVREHKDCGSYAR